MLDTPLWKTRSSNPPPAAGPRQPTAWLSAAGSGPRQLHLEGQLALGWMGRLAAGLAARRVSVVSARARQSAPRQWEAVFEIEPLDPGLDLDGLDYLGLVALAPARPPAAVPRLRAYRLTLEGDALRVELQAPDQLGFLDGILRAFARCGLFPCEMSVETRGGEALDAFALRGIGGGTPPRAIRDALEARLARLAR